MKRTMRVRGRTVWFNAGVKREPRDLWVGVYWDFERGTDEDGYGNDQRTFDIYVCVVPCLPLHLSWFWFV